MSEGLLANMIGNRRFEGGGSVSAKFSGRRGRVPPTIFAWIDRLMNICLITLLLTVFT